MGRYPRHSWTRSERNDASRFFVADGGSFVVQKRCSALASFHRTVSFAISRSPRIDLGPAAICFLLRAGRAKTSFIRSSLLAAGGWISFLARRKTSNQLANSFTHVEKQHRILPQPCVDLASSCRWRSTLNNTLSPNRERQPYPVLPHVPGRMASGIETRVLERFAPAYVVATPEGGPLYF